MRFIDASLFFNEVEVFEVRLRALMDVVDLFYVVEATREFTGRPRELVWPRHEDRFRSICNRIEYHSIDLPECGKAWEREAVQRDALDAATYRSREAWVLMGDADEIADPATIDDVLEQVTEDGFVCLRHRMAPYALNGHMDVPIAGAVAVCPTRGLHRMPERMRNERNLTPLLSRNLCGWHWTSLGGPSRIMEKLHAYSEDDPSRPDIAFIGRPEVANEAWIAEAIASGLDLFRPGSRKPVVAYLDMDDARIPDAARIVAKDYPHLVHKGIAA